MRQKKHYWTVAEVAADLGITRQRLHVLFAKCGVTPTKMHDRLVLLNRQQIETLKRGSPKPNGRPRKISVTA